LLNLKSKSKLFNILDAYLIWLTNRMDFVLTFEHAIKKAHLLKTGIWIYPLSGKRKDKTVLKNGTICILLL
jgi:hypothetical protein